MNIFPLSEKWGEREERASGCVLAYCRGGETEREEEWQIVRFLRLSQVACFPRKKTPWIIWTVLVAERRGGGGRNNIFFRYPGKSFFILCLPWKSRENKANPDPKPKYCMKNAAIHCRCTKKCVVLYPKRRKTRQFVKKKTFWKMQQGPKYFTPTAYHLHGGRRKVKKWKDATIPWRNEQMFWKTPTFNSHWSRHTCTMMTGGGIFPQE